MPEPLIQSDTTPPNSGDAGRESAPLALLLTRPGAACPHCRYSLTGLAGQSAVPDRCPECGGGLEAGLVRSTGPLRLRRLMVLMFAWLAFAGTMNATRRGLLIHDFLDRQAVMARVGSGRTGASISIVGGQIITGGGRGGGVSSVPGDWWLEVGGWSVLGLVGLGGAALSLMLTTGQVRREKRLMLLLVLAFLGYWGYHSIQFALELVGRFGA